MKQFDLRLWKGFVEAGGDPALPAIIDQVAIDSRRIASPFSLFAAMQGEFHDGHKFVEQAERAGARYALVEEGRMPPQLPINLTLLRVKNPLMALQEIAAAYRQGLTNTIFIAVTGSYGKTLLKDLLESILKRTRRTVASPESFNSQLGVALSLFTVDPEDEIAIIEAGISKKNEMDALRAMIDPDCAILTMIGNAHLSTLKNLHITAKEKLKLLQEIPGKTGRKMNWRILPKDPLLLQYLDETIPSYHFWNHFDPENLNLPHARLTSSEPRAKMPYRIDFPDNREYLGEMKAGFSYFLDLVNCAVKAAWLLDIPSKEICEAIDAYEIETMQTEIWQSPIGTTFINAPYCSDPQSIDKALKNLEQAPPHHRKVFVFGGMREKKTEQPVDYRKIGKAIARFAVDLLILFDKHPFDPLIEEVRNFSPQTELILCKSHNEAVAQMRERIKRDDFVLIKGSKKESLNSLTQSFNDSIPNNQCLINLSAIQSNIETLRSKLPPFTRIMVMVKALAYGTDDVRIAKFLATCGIEILGVSYVDEGVALRNSGVSQAIFALNPAIYEVSKVVKWNLQVGVSDLEMIQALSEEASHQNKIIKVHLHIDTGMNRFGCRPEEGLALAQQIASCPSLSLEGVMTHFACADMEDQDPFTLHQAALFQKVIDQIESHGISIPWKHAANSAAAARFDFPQFNMVRIGLAIYGLQSSEATRKALELRQALSLISRIVGINISKSGESISYGRSYKVEKEEQKIAVLPIGYFDGLHRNYSGKGEVIVRGRRAPMVGKICMDFMMIDVTEVPNVSVGDPVLIFGTDEYGQYLSPEELAGRGDSIIHELITCLGPRIQRVFITES